MKGLPIHYTSMLLAQSGTRGAKRDSGQGAKNVRHRNTTDVIMGLISACSTVVVYPSLLSLFSQRRRESLLSKE